MNPESPSRSWLVIALKIAVVAAAFGVGWHFAPIAAKSAAASHAKIAKVQREKVNYVAPSAGDLDKARADLAKVTHYLRNTGIMLNIADLRQLLDFVGGLDAGSIKALLEDSSTKPGSQAIDRANNLLIQRWAELDPRAAMDYALNIHDSQKKEIDTMEVFNSWSAHNPTEALAALSQLPEGVTGGVARLVVFKNLAQQDPQSALADAGKLPEGQQSGAYEAIFGAWAGFDPVAASENVNNLPESMRHSALQYLAEGWAAVDPAAAYAWANSFPDGPVNSVVLGMRTTDPQLAAEYAIKLPGSTANPSFINMFTDEWAQQDPVGLLAWADKNLNGAAYDSAVQAGIKQMSNNDPAGAAAYVAQFSDSGVVNQAIPSIAGLWAHKDLQAASDWALSLPTTNADVRQAAINKVVATLEDANPADAAAYVQNLSSDPGYGNITAHLATTWSPIDPQAAIDWANTLPAGNIHDDAVRTAIIQSAAVDPQAAWDASQQFTGDNLFRAIVKISGAWADQSPDQAAAAAATLPPGKNQDAATNTIAGSWLKQDPTAAIEWINSLPQGSSRDRAVTQVVASLGNKDPASAMNWAASIGNAKTRGDQIVSAATQWSSKDPSAAATAAQNAMSTPGLSAAQIKSLQAVADKASTP